MKQQRFESVISGFSGPKNLLELFHTKNVDELSFLSSLGCSRGSWAILAATKNMNEVQMRKSETAFSATSPSNIPTSLNFWCGASLYDSRISNSLRPSPFSELLHRAGSHDLAVIGVGLVVLLDILEAIEIVDHDAQRIRASPSARDRRASRSAPAVRHCRDGSAPPNRSAGPLRCALSGNNTPPAARARARNCAASSAFSNQSGSSRFSSSARSSSVTGTSFACFSHCTKPGTGDSVTKYSSFGNSRRNSSTTCLIRKLPKEIPPSPRWVLEIE